MEEKRSTPTGIVVIYGIPGSGKSTLARHLLEITDESAFIDVDWIERECKKYRNHIGDDCLGSASIEAEIMANLEQRIQKHRHLGDNGPIVSSQLDCGVGSMSSIERQNVNDIDKATLFDPEVWRWSQRIATQLVSRLITLDPDRLILVVDVFHLRSMRAAYSNIASSTESNTYCEVFIDIDLTQAIINDSTRQKIHQMGADLITKLHLQFEKRKMDEVVEISNGYMRDANLIEQILGQIHSVLRLTQRKENYQELQKKQQQALDDIQCTRQNQAHQLDLKLRETVTRLAKSTVKPGLGKILAVVKKIYLGVFNGSSSSSVDKSLKSSFDQLHLAVKFNEIIEELNKTVPLQESIEMHANLFQSMCLHLLDG